MIESRRGQTPLASNTKFEAAKQCFLAGVGQYESGRFTDAQASFEAALALVPGRVSTLGNLGATLIKLGQLDEALQLLDQALEIDPNYADAWSHRGLALADLGHYSDALACHDHVLGLIPDNLPALHQRSLMLNALGRYEEALQSCGLLLVLEPDSAEGWWARAEALHRLERRGEALAAFDKVLAINPKQHRAWSQRGGILKDLGRNDEAAAAFQQAISLGGESTINHYFLASLTGKEAPATAPRGYVESLFDDYAEQFDAHLVGVLGYRAHIVLMEHARGLGKPHFCSALDLGCGTGLCGPLIKAIANSVHGVDLSGMMLGKAGVLGIYETLAQADLSDHLQTTARRHDLVLAADVFIYVGALESVFAGVQRVLEPGGLFCFSVEQAADTHDYRLMPSQRYSHSERYLRKLAASHGFIVVKLLEHAIREEQGHAIDGLFVYLAVV